VIRFRCDQCGHKLGVPAKHAGKRGKCPKCGAAIVVPVASAAIELKCENCGQKISVPQIHAGKNARCPKCKNVLVVPTRPQAPAKTIGTVRFTCSICNREIAEPGSSRGKLVPCPHCGAYVAVPMPEKSAHTAEEPDESDRRFEELQTGSIREFKQEPKSVTERKLPWILDIFLYPASTSGMTVLATIVLTRFFFRVTVLYLGQASFVFLPFLAFFGFMWGLGMIVRIVLCMYLCWYLSECIRGSAAGGVRAGETRGYSAGLGEMFGQTLRVVGCFLVYLGPAIFYFIETERTDAIFWCLFVFGLVFLPMSFLAVAIFETWRGLNPILVAGSIFSTFLPYLAMILTFMAAGIVIVEKAPNPWGSHLTFFITWCVGVYLLMIAAHLLGWFYHRYEQQLNWEV
jgi:DNA-directed RNA polymerase subunit RPC12/RpoP